MITAALGGHDPDESLGSAGLLPESGAEQPQHVVPDGKTISQMIWQISGEAMHAYNANDMKKLFGLLSDFARIRPAAHDEKLSGYYDSQLAYVTLLTGRACADRYNVDGAYSVCERVHSLLVAKRNRQRVHGAELHADSQVWYHLLNLIAELKWKGTKEQLDRLMTPREIVEEYRLVVRRIKAQLDEALNTEEARKAAKLDAVQWCGIQVIKMIYHWQPESAPEYISEYNRTFGASFSFDAGSFLNSRPKHIDDPRYWDFEFFKICQSGGFEESDYLYCFQWRLDAVRSGRRDESALRSFRLGAELELLHMAQIKLA